MITSDEWNVLSDCIWLENKKRKNHAFGEKKLSGGAETDRKKLFFVSFVDISHPLITSPELIVFIHEKTNKNPSDV